jgi:CSLREA domain-containing protein
LQLFRLNSAAESTRLRSLKAADDTSAAFFASPGLNIMNQFPIKSHIGKASLLSSILLLVMLFVTGLIALMHHVAVVHAASFTVTITADAVDTNPGDGDCEIDSPPSGVCTLRAAIEEANALPGTDEIILPGGTYFLNRIGDDNNAFNGDLDITEDVIIRGSGADVTIIDGGAIDRVFHITQTVSVTISGITIQNGAAVNGGGIANDGGVLTVISGTIRSNQASGSGGGIYNDGALVMQNSTVMSNTAVSTGGGIHHFTGTMTLTNSTISGNVADIGGGAIFHSNGSTLLTNLTINNNSSPSGAGIAHSAGAVTLKNSIVANSIGGDDCAGTITSNGNNLDSDNSCNLGQASDLPGTDPRLEPLADYGGPTWTHALQVGSPPVDVGDDAACPALDQRGASRYGTCDIGAYEIEIYAQYLPYILNQEEASPPTSNPCYRDVPVFTTDTAPTDGTLEFRVLFGELGRIEGITLRVWDVAAGQQINNEEVQVRAPKWVRIWWQPDGEDTWYLLPSQYWSGDGTVLSEYGVSCSDADVPSYHTSFASAIPESDIPIFTLPLNFQWLDWVYIYED